MPTNVLKTGSDWLSGQLKSKIGTTVTYVRGDYSVSLTATVGSTSFDQADEFGIIERIESRDYLIDAADLVLNSVTVLPGRGDKIEETQDGTTYTYEVMTLDNQPAWRYSDSYRKKLRIHTKQIELN